MTALINEKLFIFLKQLKKNNNREWFHKNKFRYEDDVKEPLLDFICALRAPLLKICPDLKIDPKGNGGSMLRIYRDTRFAHDKSPYKTNAGLHFPYQGAQQGIHSPGFYLHLAPNESFAAAGSWHPSPQALHMIRTAIVKYPKKWEKVLKSKLILEGDSLLRPPRGFNADNPFIDDLKRKDFITSIPFSDKQVCSPRFLQSYIKACQQMAPLMHFLIEATKAPKSLL